MLIDSWMNRGILKLSSNDTSIRLLHREQLRTSVMQFSYVPGRRLTIWKCITRRSRSPFYSILEDDPKSKGNHVLTMSKAQFDGLRNIRPCLNLFLFREQLLVFFVWYLHLRPSQPVPAALSCRTDNSCLNLGWAARSKMQFDELCSGFR